LTPFWKETSDGAESRNGSSWTVVPSPSYGPSLNFLTAVSCTSELSCTAVGHWVTGGTEGEFRTLVETWNGVSWAFVPSPSPATVGVVFLSAVSCQGTTSCVAVGEYGNSTGEELTLVVSFDGSTWSIVASPNARVLLAATVGKKTDRVTWRLAYDVTMSRSGTDYSNVGSLVFAPATYTNAVAGVPTDGSLISPAATKYMKQDISVRTNIKLSDHVSMMLGYLFEKYDVSDWQNQNIPVVGGTAAAQTNIYLGTNLQNYVAHVGTVLLKYKF